MRTPAHLIYKRLFKEYGEQFIRGLYLAANRPLPGHRIRTCRCGTRFHAPIAVKYYVACNDCFVFKRRHMFHFNKEKNEFEFKLTRKQEEFAQLPNSVFEGFYGGGNASGKSAILLVYGILRRWHTNPKFKQLFMRRTFPELKNEILPRSREIYPKLGAKLNKTEMCWTFPRLDQYGSGMEPDGAMIFFGHCETEDDAHKYDSMEINLFTPDELTTFTQFIYLHIGFTRVRTPDPSIPAIIRAAGMPGGIGHSWVKKRFVFFPDGGKILVGKGGVQRIYIHATVADNPNADREYAARLDGIVSEAERKARKFGDWDSYQGQVFDDFRDRKFPDEPANALHVIPAFEIPDWWPRIVIGDWGYAALAYILFGAISPLGRLYLYREMSFLKTRVSEWGPGVKHFIDKENPVLIRFCQSAGQDRGQEHTLQGDIETAIGRPIELTMNNRGSRVATKMVVHEYLRWRDKPIIPKDEKIEYDDEYASWVLRNKTPEDYNSYLDLFKTEEKEVNLPRLQIFCCEEKDHIGHPNCCPLVIDAIKAASYDKPKDDKPAEDVAEWAGDDPYDTLRYAVDATDSYVRESGDRFSKVVRQQQLIEQLQKTNNWHSYYMQMRHSEGAAPPMQYASRYGRRRR